MTDTSERRGDTMQQLKGDIDAGRTGAKTAVVDPGAASLGTCEEAGGASLTPEQVTVARKEERKIGRIATAGDRPPTGVPLMVIAGVVAVVAVVVVAFFLTR